MSEKIKFRHVLSRDDTEGDVAVDCIVDVTWDEGAPGSASYAPGYYAEINSVRRVESRAELTTTADENEEIKDIAVGIYKGE